MNSSENNHKVALITGTSSGIGRAAALALRDAGFFVYATARDENEQGEFSGDGITTLELDVTDEESMQNAVRTAEQNNGSIQVLVNNAGYGQYGPIEEIPLDAIREQFETNVFGLLRMCQLVLPGMRRAGGGRIINLSSIAGEITQPGSGIYHATKHAVEAIDGALRTEVGEFNIRVIGIQPGPVNTNFDDVAVASIPDTGADSPYYTFKENLKKSTKEMLNPEGTMVLQPEDVAKVIVEAATDDSPQTRYRVGMMAKAMAVARGLMPDKIWDAAVAQMVPVDEKK
jgi:NAD(P)-dependent dehydrogenase (short-subunit alcohol dehydrogenase family)